MNGARALPAGQQLDQQKARLDEGSKLWKHVKKTLKAAIKAEGFILKKAFVKRWAENRLAHERTPPLSATRKACLKEIGDNAGPVAGALQLLLPVHREGESDAVRVLLGKGCKLWSLNADDLRAIASARPSWANKTTLKTSLKKLFDAIGRTDTSNPHAVEGSFTTMNPATQGLSKKWLKSFLASKGQSSEVEKHCAAVPLAVPALHLMKRLEAIHKIIGNDPSGQGVLLTEKGKPGIQAENTLFKHVMPVKAVVHLLTRVSRGSNELLKWNGLEGVYINVKGPGGEVLAVPAFVAAFLTEEDSELLLSAQHYMETTFKGKTAMTDGIPLPLHLVHDMLPRGCAIQSIPRVIAF